MKYYFLIFLLVSLLFAIPIQQSYGLVSGVSEYFDEQPNLYKIGAGLKEFVEDPKTTPCTATEFEIKNTNLLLDPVKKLTETEGNFFMFLNEHGSDSYQYLKVVMPEREGQPRYYGYVYDENNNIVDGYGYGLDSGSLVVGIETFDIDAVIDEDKRLVDFMEDKSDFGLPAVVKQGDYHANIVLYHYEQPRTERETCTIVVDWEFSVNDNGQYMSDNVDMRTGTLVDVTTEFSPLKQVQLHVESFAIKCKEGFQKLSQKIHPFYENRTACVSPETRDKLIERGWNLAKPKLELTNFSRSQEMKIGKVFENFLKNENRFEISTPFVIGKYNFANNDTITHFCGFFKESEKDDVYFRGAVNSLGDIEWGSGEDLTEWCLVNDDAHVFNDANGRNSN